MKWLFSFFLLLLFVLSARGQGCAGLISDAKKLIEQAEFDRAVKKVEAAKGCASQAEIDALYDAVFDGLKKQTRQAEQAKIQAEKAEKKALAEQRKADSLLQISQADADASYNAALALQIKEYDPTLALRLAEYNYDRHPKNVNAASTFGLTSALTNPYYNLAFYSHTEPIMLIDWLNNDDNLLTVANDTGIVWDTQNGKLIKGLELVGSSYNISPDQKTICSTFSNCNNFEKAIKIYGQNQGLKESLEKSEMLSRHLFFYSVESGEYIGPQYASPTCISNFAWSPNSKQIAICSIDSTVRVFDIESNKNTYIFTALRSNITTITWSPKGEYIFCGLENGGIIGWDVEKKEAMFYNQTHNGEVSALVFSPNGNQLASASWDDEKLIVWDIEKDEEVYSKKTYFESSKGVAWSPDGNYLALGAESGEVYIVDMHKNEEIISLRGHKEEITVITWAKDSNKLATGAKDNSIKVWDIRQIQGGSATKMKYNEEKLKDIAWSPNGKLICSVFYYGSTIIWNAETFLTEDVLDSVLAVEVSWMPDSNHLFVHEGGAMSIWDVEKQNRICSKKGFELNALPSPDASLIATKLFDGGVYTMCAHEKVLSIEGDFSVGGALGWSPKGDKIAIGYNRDKLGIWDIDKQMELFSINNVSPNGGGSVSWSPNGKIIIYFSNHRQIRLFNIESHKELYTIDVPNTTMGEVAWSPSGKHFAATIDGELRIWDFLTGQMIFDLIANNVDITCFAWSPKGDKIVGGCDDGTMYIWDLFPVFNKSIFNHSLSNFLKHGAKIHESDIKKLQFTDDILLLAQQYESYGEAEKALKAYKKVSSIIADKKTRDDIIFKQFLLALGLGLKFELTFLDSIETIEVLSQVSSHFIEKEDWGKAVYFYKKLINLDTSYIDISKNLSLMEINKLSNLSKKAGIPFDVLKLNYSKNEYSFDAISDYFREIEDWTQALEFAQKALDKKPDTERLQKVLELVEQVGLTFNVTTLPHEDAEACDMLATFFEKRRDWTQTQAFAQKALEKEPNAKRLQKVLDLVKRSGQPFDLGPLVQSEDQQLLLTMGRHLYQKQDWAACERVIQQMLKLEDSPNNRQNLFTVRWKKGLDSFEELFSTVEPDMLQGYFEWFSSEASVQQSDTDKHFWYDKTVQIGERLLHQQPQNTTLQDTLAGYCNTLAWYSLITGRFAEAEQAVLRGLALDSSLSYLQLSLPPALLLQDGRFAEARELYKEWMDEPFDQEQNLPTFREAFLQDLEALGAAGVIPAERREEVEAIRKLLQGEK